MGFLYKRSGKTVTVCDNLCANTLVKAPTLCATTAVCSSVVCATGSGWALRTEGCIYSSGCIRSDSGLLACTSCICQCGASGYGLRTNTCIYASGQVRGEASVYSNTVVYAPAICGTTYVCSPKFCSSNSYFCDEYIAFGWGGGWFQTEATKLCLRGNKILHSVGVICSTTAVCAPIVCATSSITSPNISCFWSPLSGNDDWQSSPITIRERGLNSSACNHCKYAPNINFHWGSIYSNSLWMSNDGWLNWGSYDASGIPARSNGFCTDRLCAITAVCSDVVCGTTAVRGTHCGNGAGLTSLNASNLSSGTVATARLPAAALCSYTLASLGGVTCSYVQTQINALVDSAPGALNTLNELAAAMGDDANHATTMTNLIATKLALTGGTLDGGTNTTLNIRADDAGVAKLVIGASTNGSQGTGVVEVTQDGSHGGGMSYNGDGSPAWASGETADWTTFYALNAGTRTEVFGYSYASTGAVTFNGALTWSGGGSANANTAYTHSQSKHLCCTTYWNVDNWLSYTGGAGLYWPACAGYHLYPTSNTCMTLRNNQANIGLRFYTSTGSLTMGFLYGDCSLNFGLKDYNDNWRVRVHGTSSISLCNPTCVVGALTGSSSICATTCLCSPIVCATGTSGYTLRTDGCIYSNSTIVAAGDVVATGTVCSTSCVRSPVLCATGTGLNANGKNIYNAAIGGESSNCTTFRVCGFADCFYPVCISRGGGYGMNRYSISRHYAATAPSTWYTSTHKGGLTFTWIQTADTAWGGNSKGRRVIDLHEQYSCQIGGWVHTVSGVIVFLRGGCANYDVHGHSGQLTTVCIYDGSSGSTYGHSHSSCTYFVPGDGACACALTCACAIACKNSTIVNSSVWPLRNANGAAVSICGNGAGLTSLNASNLSSGTVATARLPAAALCTGDITNVAAGGGITGGGSSGSVTITHADTSSASNIDTSGAAVVNQLNVDTYGHVTTLNTRNLTLANLGYTGATNANYITNNSQLSNSCGYTTCTGNVRTDTANGFTAGAIQTFCSCNNIATTSGSQAGLQVYHSGTGLDAFMTFHVGGDYALYFGLDGGTNKLSVGGWSMGAASYEIYHAGNKPSLATLGYTGATNANYITNNSQLSNSCGYTTCTGNVINGQSSISASDFYAASWLRNCASGSGMYNQSTGQHFYSDHDDFWNIAGGSTANGLRFRDEHAGTVRGYVYADNSNSVGFLDAGASWAYKIVNDSSHYWMTNDSTTRMHLNTSGCLCVCQGVRAPYICGTTGVYGTHSGSGASLTSLNASNLSSGTVATARLPAAALCSYTLCSLGYTGATNANYITNNSQLSNSCGYTTCTGNVVNGQVGTLYVVGTICSATSICGMIYVKTPEVCATTCIMLSSGTNHAKMCNSVGFVVMDSTEGLLVRDNSANVFSARGTGNCSLKDFKACCNVYVCGSLSKYTGCFSIPHPDPAKNSTHNLQHSFVESPTEGDNIYRWQVDTSNCSSVITLPSYYKYLNKNDMVWVSPYKSFGAAYGEVTEDQCCLIVCSNQDGCYNVLLIGTRKDENAESMWTGAEVLKPEDEGAPTGVPVPVHGSQITS
jgi:hypothetical protein